MINTFILAQQLLDSLDAQADTESDGGKQDSQQDRPQQPPPFRLGARCTLSPSWLVL